jgi:DUF1680 family protein
MERKKPTTMKKLLFILMLKLPVIMPLLVLVFAAILSACSSKNYDDQETLYPFSSLHEVSFTEVKIQDNFWLPKIKLVQETTIPHLLDIAETEGKLDNFRILAGTKQGKIKLHNAPDSDVYKLIEAAAYSFTCESNKALETRVDKLIDEIAAAQQPDGYINTQYTLNDNHPSSPNLDTLHARRFGYGEKDRWNSTLEKWPYAYSQLYCSGHLMEAAVAYYRATGKRKLLDTAIKNAEHIKSIFNLEKIKMYADHPQLEIGLMKLYEITGNKEYQQLAEDFSRYVKFARPRDIVLTESSKPLAEQREAYSHCVRTGYIYTSATGCIRTNGANDLSTAIHSLWENLTARKMYIHGGTGNGTKFEQHGHDYDLPILNTYSESCAQIAQCQWNHELNLLNGDSKFADIIEWEAYNGALAGFGMDGKTFLYSNKLNIDTLERKDYHSGVRTSYLFCCPSKIPGFITGINRWIYAKDENSIYVNLFIGSRVSTKIGKENLVLEQQTNYPWDGGVSLVLCSTLKTEKSLKIRVPGWNSDVRPLPLAPYYFGDEQECGFEVKFNGKELNKKDYQIEKGYLVFKQKFRKSDKIDINFDMPVRRLYTDTLVKANLGRVALTRGPVIYSLEGKDNQFDVLQMILPKNNTITAEFRKSMLGGVYVLKGEGVLKNENVSFKAIPYFAWQNRGIYQMSTLLIENPEVIQQDQNTQGEINTDG